MPRLALALLFCLLASTGLAQESAPSTVQPRRDNHGDLLPVGALRRLGTTRFRQDYVDSIAFKPDGKSIVVQGSGRVIHWDAATGKQLRMIPTSLSGNR